MITPQMRPAGMPSVLPPHMAGGQQTAPPVGMGYAPHVPGGFAGQAPAGMNYTPHVPAGLGGQQAPMNIAPVRAPAPAPAAGSMGPAIPPGSVMLPTGRLGLDMGNGLALAAKGPDDAPAQMTSYGPGMFPGLARLFGG